LEDRVELLLDGAAAFGIRLNAGQAAVFRRYHEKIVEENSRVNLTRVTDWEQVQVRHFLDSLSTCMALPEGLLRSGGDVLDVGSGAGLPGLALKIAFPALRMTLIEASRKKAGFLDRVVDELSLSDVTVLSGRAETLAHDERLRQAFDSVLARAVARLDVLAELTLPFCRIGGLVVAQKGPRVQTELRDAGRAVEVLGGELKEVVELALPADGGSRTLVVLRKVRSTPEGYPRRPGVPKKRPLSLDQPPAGDAIIGHGARTP
jgi:16S rRNA (guanine527-N7)-methyltransferase